MFNLLAVLNLGKFLPPKKWEGETEEEKQKRLQRIKEINRIAEIRRLSDPLDD
jgi:hypothetical protein